jgi:hypothetical protein
MKAGRIKLLTRWTDSPALNQLKLALSFSLI